MTRGAGAARRGRPSKGGVDADVRLALAWLERRGTRRNREGMARYGIVAKKVFGVSMGTMQSLARRLGKRHDLAAALWKTGWYEARMLACLVDEPARVTPAQMERWAKAFDNWAICDTATFVLFDRTPHAWAKAQAWSKRPEEFVKRAAFAMLASLTIHDKAAPDEPYRRALALIEREAGDDRNFVKKAVNWALRSIGKRSPGLHRDAVALARRLAESALPSARWVGKDALRELTSPAVRRRLAARAGPRPENRPRAGRRPGHAA